MFLHSAPRFLPRGRPASAEVRSPQDWYDVNSKLVSWFHFFLFRQDGSKELRTLHVGKRGEPAMVELPPECRLASALLCGRHTPTISLVVVAVVCVGCAVQHHSQQLGLIQRLQAPL